MPLAQGEQLGYYEILLPIGKGARSQVYEALVNVVVAIAVSQTLIAGPNRWTNVGPEGGSVFRIAADPLDPSKLYAGTCAGIFKSVDGGASWSAANTGLPTNDNCSEQQTEECTGAR
jgi:hypothetical protein